MKIIQVSYRRVFNLGNYQTEAIEFVAAVNDGENPQEVLRDLATETFAWQQTKKAGGR